MDIIIVRLLPQLCFFFFFSQRHFLVLINDKLEGWNIFFFFLFFLFWLRKSGGEIMSVKHPMDLTLTSGRRVAAMVTISSAVQF